ncbi:MAG: hypothetical protein ACYS1A_19440 [Planctomycetota bacterium]
MYVIPFSETSVYYRLRRIVHEYRHILQGRAEGWGAFYGKYLNIDGKFRIESEVEAHIDEMYVMDMVGRTINIDGFLHTLKELYFATDEQLSWAQTRYLMTLVRIDDGGLNPILQLWKECYPKCRA